MRDINKKSRYTILLFLLLASSCKPDSKSIITNAVVTPSYNEIYDSSSVESILFTFEAKEWQVLQDFEDDLPDNARGTSINEYPYAKMTISYKDQKWSDVGLRYKGNSSFIKGDKKHSLKISFEHFKEDNLFFGLKKLNLNNAYGDASLIRECIAYEAFKRAGVVASRCNFIFVFIDKGDGSGIQKLGLYTNVEAVDKRFISDRFGTASTTGNIFKPEPEMGVSEFADLSTWYENPILIMPPNMPPRQSKTSYETIGLKTNEESSDFSDVKSFIENLQTLKNSRELVETFLPTFFNVDQFLRQLAMNNILSNWDSYPGTITHNFYVFKNPINPSGEKSDYWQIIPWDLNGALGGFNVGMPIAYKNDLEKWPSCFASTSEVTPGTYTPILVDLVMGVANWKVQYHNYLIEFASTGGAFAREDMLNKAEELHNLVYPFVNYEYSDNSASFEAFNRFHEINIVDYINKRLDFLLFDDSPNNENEAVGDIYRSCD